MANKGVDESFRLEIINARGNKTLMTIENVPPRSTIADLKKLVAQRRTNLYADRQSFRPEPTGKSLKDDQLLSSVNVDQTGKIYFKDLGPQIGWATVFLAEYAGPLLIYLLFYFRPSWIYGSSSVGRAQHPSVHLGAYCWTFHYGKRILETLFVHRFSHSTMPLFNLFKNCGYYWGFTAMVSYFVNHPEYTPALYGPAQVYAGLLIFILSELGNFSIHLLLRDLRPAGSTKRQIPFPNKNPLTKLFDLVSCPNYTYEIGSWIGFTLMTQTLTALLFTLAGAGQMTIWALGKHRAYKQEFKEKYPRQRKSIIPFLV